MVYDVSDKKRALYMAHDLSRPHGLIYHDLLVFMRKWAIDLPPHV